MNKVRAKVKVMGKTTFSESSGGSVTLGAVYSTDPNHENKVFSDYTPSLNVTIQLNKQPAFDFFESGQEYYLDFIKPEEAE